MKPSWERSCCICFLPVRRLPISTLFPYTTLFRSAHPPIEACQPGGNRARVRRERPRAPCLPAAPEDRKSTRLNSSHLGISYAVFCLKKKRTCGIRSAPDRILDIIYLQVRGRTPSI